MSAHNQSHSDHATTPKPAAQAGISKEPPEKRRRVHSQVASTNRGEEESPDNDDEALRHARALVAAEEERNLKRLRDAEIDIKRMYSQHTVLKKSHDDHKTAVEAGQNAIKTSISQLEDDLKKRPTSTDVQKIVDTEREARQHALNEHVAKLPSRIAGSMNILLQDFQDTKLKSMLIAEMASTKRRIGSAESSLDTIHKAVDSLNSIVGDKSNLAEVKQQIVTEVKREIMEASGKMTVKFTTQLDTRIQQCTFNMETVAIPHALEPLRARIDHISGACTSIEEKLVTVTQLQRKHGEDGKGRYKELENTFRPTQHLHTKKIEQLDNEVQALQKDLHAERNNILAERKKTSTLETSIKVLQNELKIEREERKKTESSNEAILRRLQVLEHALVTAKEAQDTFDARLKQAAAQTAAALLNQERTFRTQLEEQAKAAMVDVASVKQVLQLKMTQQKAVITGHFEEILNARHLEGLRNRVEKLETTMPPKEAGPDKVGAITEELASLKETVVGLAASASNFGEHVDNIRPMLTDIAELKDQHCNHIASCKAQVLEQARIAMAQSKNTEAMLKGRLTSQEISLRNHLFEAHDIVEKPASVKQRTQSNVPSLRRHERRRQTALAVRVRRDAKRINHVSCTVHTMKSDFDFLKSCVAEDVQNMDSRTDMLMQQHDNLQAQQTQMNIRVTNLEGPDRKRSRLRSESSQYSQAI